MRWINLANILALGFILLVSSVFLISLKKEEISVYIPRIEPKELPKSPFSECDPCFAEIGQSILALAWVPPQMQLPDLRQELLFCGKNARPDSLTDKTGFYFVLKPTQERFLIKEGERIYLIYQGSSYAHNKAPTKSSTQKAAEERSLYILSPNNQPTSLWFEVKEVGDHSVEVSVSMLDEKGIFVSSPADVRHFRLHFTESNRGQVHGWDLEGLRVDTSLLVRQKARWVGKDLFLEMHGGKEFVEVVGKERIDFVQGNLSYSCFVALGDFIIWKNGHWSVAGKEECTQKLPLMVVKKIEEKIISFEIWDPEGKGKVHASLIKAKDSTGMPNMAHEFKFVGAKSWTQFIVESRSGIRMTLKPYDWLVLTQEGWIKLESSEQIDAFVAQTIQGPLFILEKMVKNNGRQVLVGHLFNSIRTDIERVELISSFPSPLTNFHRQMSLSPPIQPQISHIEEVEE